VNYADDNSPFAFGESIPSVVSQIEKEAESPKEAKKKIQESFI